MPAKFTLLRKPARSHCPKTTPCSFEGRGLSKDTLAFLCSEYFAYLARVFGLVRSGYEGSSWNDPEVEGR